MLVAQTVTDTHTCRRTQWAFVQEQKADKISQMKRMKILFQNSNFALINGISVTVTMDQINGWPKQLPCLSAMTGSCREPFRHFVLMSFKCCSVLHAAPKLCQKCPLYLSFSLCSSLMIDILVPINYLFSTFVMGKPSLGLIVYFYSCLGNGSLSAIFAPGVFAALRPFLSLTLCIPSLPIIATRTNSEESLNRSISVYFQLQIWIFRPFPQTKFSLFVSRVCGILVTS